MAVWCRQKEARTELDAGFPPLALEAASAGPGGVGVGRTWWGGVGVETGSAARSSAPSSARNFLVPELFKFTLQRSGRLSLPPAESQPALRPRGRATTAVTPTSSSFRRHICS